MDDKQSLMAQIIAQPNSNEARLMLADWYAEQSHSSDSDQAYARFIRKQIQSYTIEYGSGAKHKLYDLSESIRQMLATHEGAWSATFLPAADKVTYHRGCVELIRCNAKQFQHAAHLFELAPIRHLDVVVNDPQEISLLDQKHLLNIQSLSINKCAIGDIGVSYLDELEYLQNLTWLSLCENNINEEGVECLIRMENAPLLQYVDLTGNPCDPIENFADEFGAITDSWLPEVGENLEKRHGRVNWFHREGEDILSWHLDRFHLAARS